LPYPGLVKRIIELGSCQCGNENMN
jgi:hypothetical protein